MSYQSIIFLIFCAIVLVLYYALGRRMQRYVLAAANFVFYAYADFRYIPFILITIAATFITGRRIQAAYDDCDKMLSSCTVSAEKKALRAQAKKKAKRDLLTGMLSALVLLMLCKYTNFLVENLNAITGMFGMEPMPLFKMILPLGISFYTFMALSYVLDVYWKRYPAEKSFLTYAVYLSYFPHVTQGPIDRFNEFRDQIKEGISFNPQNITFGAQLMLWGFFKKLVIADRFGMLVNHVFDSWSEMNGMMLVIAVAAYSIQIYADFSGCIDIVSGVSEMLGIKIRKNFNHPYFSRTMGEFWRRWHMSLQEWFKDYVYYPVSTSGLIRKGKKHFAQKNMPRALELFSSCVPVWVVWMITGIWHGASWNYVIWGVFHAILLTGSQIFDPVFRKTTALLRINTESYSWHLWQMTRTFILCGIGRIFFRTADFASAVGYIGRMFLEFRLSDITQNFFTYGINAKNMNVAIAAVAVLWCVDLLQERMSLRETIARQGLVFRWMISLLGLAAVVIFGIYGPGYNVTSFIYQQF